MHILNSMRVPLKYFQTYFNSLIIQSDFKVINNALQIDLTKLYDKYYQEKRVKF